MLFLFFLLFHSPYFSFSFFFQKQKPKTKPIKGKILFAGRSNNEMLRMFMELIGPFPRKMLRRSKFWQKYFTPDNFIFRAEVTDEVTGQVPPPLSLTHSNNITTLRSLHFDFAFCYTIYTLYIAHTLHCTLLSALYSLYSFSRKRNNNLKCVCICIYTLVVYKGNEHCQTNERPQS